MEPISANTRIVIALLFIFVVVIVTASLQNILGFSTYVALVICMIAAGIFAWINTLH
jgi:hypothetical protein